MKNLMLFIAFVLAAGTTYGQATKTYVKTIDPQASQQIQLEFDYAYVVEEWDDENLRLLIDVQLKNANEKILEQLMLAGRYKITKKKDGDVFKLDIPGMKKEVVLGGKKLEEVITLKIMVPRYTLVESMDEGGMASVNIKRGITQEMADKGVTARFDPTFYEFDVEVNVEVAACDKKTEVKESKMEEGKN